MLLACQGCHPGSLYERRTAVWLVAVRVWRFPGPPASVGSPDLVDEEVVHLHQFVSATLMRSYSVLSRRDFTKRVQLHRFFSIPRHVVVVMILLLRPLSLIVRVVG